MTRLPDANAHFDEIAERLTDGTPVVLLDFDGTLAPIVERPTEAAVPDETRAIVERLAEQTPVAVVSGRDLEDVRSRVDLPTLAYSGSHGFEIQLPGETERTVDKGRDYLEALDTVEARLTERLADLPGVDIERKRYGIAVHVRRASESDSARTERVIRQVLDEVGGLANTRGKEVFDLRPALDWDKGDAVDWMLEKLYPADARPMYIGDDVTDEDAFEALRERGIGVVVDPGERPTAARYRLADPEAVRACLAELVGRFDNGRP